MLKVSDLSNVSENREKHHNDLRGVVRKYAYGTKKKKKIVSENKGITMTL